MQISGIKAKLANLPLMKLKTSTMNILVRQEDGGPKSDDPKRGQILCRKFGNTVCDGKRMTRPLRVKEDNGVNGLYLDTDTVILSR